MSESDIPVVVHVGYPKTGTTTLQRHLFSSHPEIDYFGKFIPDRGTRLGNINSEIDRLIHENDKDYNGSILKNLIASGKSSCVRKILLLSYEEFICPGIIDWAIVARRIRKVFYPCKILITLRNQLDILSSWYDYAGKFGRYLFAIAPIQVPLSFAQWYAMYPQEKNFPALLHYYDIVNYYVSLFGRANVGIFLIEELVKYPDYYTQKIAKFLGVDPNVAIDIMRGKHENARFTVIESLYRDLCIKLGTSNYDWTRSDSPRWITKLGKLLGKNTVRIDPKLENEIQNLYSAGNQRLAEEFGIPLQEFGYGLCESSCSIDKVIFLKRPFIKESGFAWLVPLKEFAGIADCRLATYRSCLELLEDDKLLWLRHSCHDDIRNKGLGRYSHWGETLYFSTSDNSDPNTNGHDYKIVFSAGS